MKTKLYLFVAFTVCCAIMACKKMDSTYKDYIVVGGVKYPGRAAAAKFYAGKNRLKLEWLRGTDPTIVKAIIYWNNFTDSLVINVPADQDTISHTFTDLPEDYYSYTIRTYDAEGHVSVPVELSGGVYGDIFQESILERPVRSALFNKKNQLVIEWEEADTLAGAFATEVEYTNTLGAVKVKRFKTKDAVSQIEDYLYGTDIKYRTLYIPEALSIDTFYTVYQTRGNILIDKKDWSIVSFSSQHPGDENKVLNFIDGDPNTRWHANASTSNYPHYAVIDMGAVRTLEKVGLWRMTDDERAPDLVQIFTSTDNVTFTNQGIFSFNRSINGEQVFNLINPIPARYFKVVGLTGPVPYMVMGEVMVYGGM